MVEVPNGPLKKVEARGSKVEEIAQDLGSYVFGQEKALQVIARRIALIEARLQSPNGPLGAIFELGPTGVGKTEISRAIAARWFDDPDSPRVKVINGSEFSEQHDIKKFTGSPQGYVGHEEESVISHDWLHAKSPKGMQVSIIVVDEVDKMHPDIPNKIFLPILDKATLSARKGKDGFQPLDFTNTLFIFTSNLGSEEMLKASGTPLGFSSGNTQGANKDLESIGMREFKKAFRPEFINRLTDVTVFDRLENGSGIYEKIFDKLMAQKNADMRGALGARSPKIVIDPELRAKVISRIDVAYGARYLNREIDKNIMLAFAEIIHSYHVTGATLHAGLDQEGEVGFYCSKTLRPKASTEKPPPSQETSA